MPKLFHTISSRLSSFRDHLRSPSRVYDKGLNGKEAVWASKKYRDHRVLPESLLRDLDNAH
ncbi:hypothetical protein PILCRDRAFT_762294 [Piloderma croceum F 1598]|uniref:Uncharacterized protein n=1 Tax=Piloderma croceum (strain F 1598) TaxID=765440 RepID=A0A0C3G7V2_PILCF|nr:hypothetical protein PILCRDRAFT_762294 [Piloderma croceum F 1598]